MEGGLFLGKVSSSSPSLPRRLHALSSIFLWISNSSPAIPFPSLTCLHLIPFSPKFLCLSFPNPLPFYFPKSSLLLPHNLSTHLAVSLPFPLLSRSSSRNFIFSAHSLTLYSVISSAIPFSLCPFFCRLKNLSIPRSSAIFPFSFFVAINLIFSSEFCLIIFFPFHHLSPPRATFLSQKNLSFFLSATSLSSISLNLPYLLSLPHILLISLLISQFLSSFCVRSLLPSLPLPLLASLRRSFFSTPSCSILLLSYFALSFSLLYSCNLAPNFSLSYPFLPPLFQNWYTISLTPSRFLFLSTSFAIFSRNLTHSLLSSILRPLSSAFPHSYCLDFFRLTHFHSRLFLFLMISLTPSGVCLFLSLFLFCGPACIFRFCLRSIPRSLSSPHTILFLSPNFPSRSISPLLLSF